jgi:hypothetical protein
MHAHDLTESRSQHHKGRRKQHLSFHLDRMCRMAIRRWRSRVDLPITTHRLLIDTPSQRRDAHLSSVSESSLLHTQSNRLATLTQQRAQRTTRFPCVTKQLFHTITLITTSGTDYNNRKRTPRWEATKTRNQRSSCLVTTITSKARHASVAICQSNLLRS